VAKVKRTIPIVVDAEEVERSRSQFATLKSGHGQNMKYRPYAFTEHGAIQAASNAPF
jgi:hypothetical protein